MKSSERHPSKVGYMKGIFEDIHRSNWQGTGYRPIHWLAWYPANEEAIEKPALIGPSQAPIFTMGMMAYQASLKASPHPYPVVLLSHGFGGSAATLGWMGSALASQGFVVIGVDHHGNTTLDSSPEGAICWWERPRDLSVILDHLSKETFFTNQLDLDRVFAIGYSLGCHSVLMLLGGVTYMDTLSLWIKNHPHSTGSIPFTNFEAQVAALLNQNKIFRTSWEHQSDSKQDSRIKAGMLWAPPIVVRSMTLNSLKEIHTPVEIIAGDADHAAPLDHANWLHDHLSNSHLTILHPHIGHYIFLCEGTEAGKMSNPKTWCDHPGVDRQAIHTAIANQAIHLFSKDSLN